MPTEQSRKPESQGFQGSLALFRREVLDEKLSKALRLPRERSGAPVEIHIATMAGFHKNGSSEPLLWNDAVSAGRNRKAVSSRGQHYTTFRRKRPAPGAARPYTGAAPVPFPADLRRRSPGTAAGPTETGHPFGRSLSGNPRSRTLSFALKRPERFPSDFPVSSSGDPGVGRLLLVFAANHAP